MRAEVSAEVAGEEEGLGMLRNVAALTGAGRRSEE